MKSDFIGDIAGRDSEQPIQRKYTGIAVGQVISVLYAAMLGRVQLRLSIAPDLNPWAAVASPMAGFAHGWYSMPQVGDSVVVAFNNGDVREPYVIGAVWNTIRRPPIVVPSEAVSKRVLRTPAGHQIAFDDATQSLTITSTTQQEIGMDPARIELKAGLGAASVQVTTDGAVRITSATSIELNAPKISLNGATVDITAATSASLNGGASCSVKGAMVRIN